MKRTTGRENPTIPWKNKKPKGSMSIWPDYDMTIVKVWPENQARYLEKEGIALSTKELELAGREKTDFLVLTENEKVLAVFLSPPSDEDCKTLILDRTHPTISGAIKALAFRLYV